MAENTGIEWADDTFNPWIGCTKISPACDHCYAETWNQRFDGGKNWGPGAPRRRTSAANWNKPLKWNREAKEAKKRRRVFCASLADVFDNEVDPKWRADLWELIKATPNLDWLILTKRPQNIEKMLPTDWWPGYHNVWLGVTVENQREADRRIPLLIDTPARVRFLSMEPLLGPVDLCNVKGHLNALFPDPKIDWVITGGESGPNARPSNEKWFRAIREQCRATKTAFLFKQWGDWIPGGQLTPAKREKYAENLSLDDVYIPPGEERDTLAMMARIGKRLAGRILDGRVHDGFPEVLPP